MTLPGLTPGDDITAAENVLRDLIQSTLGSGADDTWLETSGLTPERLERMHARLSEERERRQGGVVEQRLLYYSDLPDLKTIIDKAWDRFKPCLNDKKTFDVHMDRLVDLRTAQMHGRELLPFERSLAAGISGEFRNRVTIFRSIGGPNREFFPRIEYVRDSFGNTRRGYGSDLQHDETGLTLHPGDVVTFDCRGWDPETAPFSWHVIVHIGRSEEFDSDSWEWAVVEGDIAERKEITFYLTSSRSYHRRGTYDDAVSLVYRVLPRS